MAFTPNIWSDEWEHTSAEEWAAGKLSVMALTESQFGRRLWDLRTLDDTQE